MGLAICKSFTGHQYYQ